VDDSGNLGAPASIVVNVTCPCSVWGTNMTPGTLDSLDPNAVELGMKFKSDVDGTVNAIRFYKSSKNTGSHVGNLWTTGGQLLARATFTGETASGWQTVNLSPPAAVSANTVYIVSYFAPVGHYSQDSGYMFAAPAPQPDGNDSLDSPPLHALRNASGVSNGVYSYGSSTTFPTSTYNGENYWVDVVFSPATPPGQVTNVVASAGNAAATVTWAAPGSGGVPTSYTVTPYVGSVGQTPTVVGGSPAPTNALVTGLSNGTTYTFTVTASNSTGSGPASAASNSVTPSASASLVLNGGFESGLSAWATGGVTLPVASTAKPHTGTGSALLGTLSGSEPTGNSTLSQAVAIPSSGASMLTFFYWPASTDELCTGSACTYDWQEAQIRDTAGNTLASLFKVDSNAQTWQLVTADLTPFAGRTVVIWFNVRQDGANPADDTSMYLDDVSVTNSQPTTPGAPTGVTAVAGNSAATITWTAPANGGSAITSYAVTPYVGTVAQPATTVSGTSTSAVISGLSNGTTYTFTVNATNAIGSGPASSPSNSVTPSPAATPAFVQASTAHGLNKSNLTVMPAAPISTGNRLVVEVGVWNSRNATAASVTDSAGNVYTEVLHFVASEGTEQSIWTAPITAGGGTRPTVTVTPTTVADVGVGVVEYSGLSTASGTGAVDRIVSGSGTTGSPATVSSGSTASTTADGELAIGCYSDSGFGTTPAAGSGWSMRARIAGVNDMDLLIEDQLVPLGATPAATASTGGNTVWLMSTVVFKHG
jgi:Domain of unknown function (DUF4082)/Fibronectin type III domain